MPRFPESTIRHVRTHLNALDVLEYLDWHPEAIQRQGNKLRACCPIHQETNSRSLVVDGDTHSYICSATGCLGSGGGDLIDLVARSRHLSYDKSLELLADEFSIEFIISQDESVLDEILEEAESQIAELESDPVRAAHGGAEVAQRVAQVLGVRPEDPRTLKLLVRLRRLTGQADEEAELLSRLVEAERRSGNVAESVRLAREILETNVGNLPVRQYLADHHLQMQEIPQAIEQLMLLADSAEVAGQLDIAIDAYRRLDLIGSDQTGFDAVPMVLSLLETVGRPQEALQFLYGKADHWLARKDFTAAADVLRRVVELSPADGHARGRLIAVLCKQGLDATLEAEARGHLAEIELLGAHADAVSSLQRMTAALPQDMALQERLSVAYLRAGDHASARELRMQIANAHRIEGHRTNARAILDLVLESEPQDIEALRLCAELEIEAGNKEQALVHLRLLEQIYSKSNQWEDMLAAINRMLDVSPARPELLTRLSNVYVKLGRTEEAIAALDRGQAHLRSAGEWDAAAEVLRLSVSLNPENPRTMMEYADVLAVLNQAGDSARWRMQAADLLMQHGEYVPAEKQLVKLLEQDPENDAASRFLATALVGLNRPKDAVKVLRAIAQRYSDRGELARARESLEELLRYDAQDLDALQLLKKTCMTLGDEEAQVVLQLRLLKVFKARRKFQEAIEQGEVAVQIRHNNIDARRELVELYVLTGQDELVEHHSWELSRALRETGDVAGETAMIRGLIERNPMHLKARERLLDLLHRARKQEELLFSAKEYVALCSQESKLDKAIDVLRELIQRDADNADLQEVLVGVYEMADQPDMQVEQMLSLMTVHERHGNVDEMIALYHALLALKPQDLVHRERLIDLLRRNGRTLEAVDELIHLGQRYLEVNDLEMAGSWFRQSLELSADEERAWRGLVDIAIATGKVTDALGHLRQIALLQARAHRFDEAVNTLRGAFTLDPTNTQIRREIVDVCVREEYQNITMALMELDELARSYMDRGNREASITARKEATGLRPNDAQLRWTLVNELLDADRNVEAISELLEIAEIHRARGKYDEALVVLDQALEKDHDNVEARMARARLLEEAGEEKLALEEWRRLAPLLGRGRMASTAATSSAPVTAAQEQSTSLSIVPEYDFDHFVVGERNRFAWATAMAVAKAPGETPHNPLFLHADVGLGKTHILHAIANFVVATKPNAKFLYTNAEDFTGDLVDAIQHNAVHEFRQRHKSVDLLLLDDVHFLAGKERAQEEFFHIFNTLYQARKQIVITSDRPPREIEHLEKRLKSRFGAGVIVDMQSPDVETRQAILQRLAAKKPELEIPEQVLTTIAEGITANIRELKGAFQQLVLLHEVGGQPLNEDTAKKAVEKFAGSS